MPGKPGAAGRGKPTSSDVAAAAGVSRSAVSFAFNSPYRISASTRERILAAAQEIGYTPNTLARMLQAGRTHSLGVLLPQALAKVMENPYYSRFLMGVGQVCDQEGFTLLLAPPVGDSMLKAIPYAAVDGFIVCGLETDRGEVAELERRNIPLVLVDSDPQDDVPSVDVDDQGGARDVVRHLLELGHRRLAVLSMDPGPDARISGYRGPLGRRMAGIAEALGEAGLSMTDIPLAEVTVTRADGYRAAKTLLAEHTPTAIVTMSDILAFGAVDALHDLGLRIPEDVSITGFDDLAESAWLRPRLTTVRQAIVTKGRTAADFLISAIRGEDQHPHQLLNTALIVRESTAAPRTEVAGSRVEAAVGQAKAGAPRGGSSASRLGAVVGGASSASRLGAVVSGASSVAPRGGSSASRVEAAVGQAKSGAPRAKAGTRRAEGAAGRAKSAAPAAESAAPEGAVGGAEAVVPGVRATVSRREAAAGKAKTAAPRGGSSASRLEAVVGGASSGAPGVEGAAEGVVDGAEAVAPGVRAVGKAKSGVRRGAVPRRG
jgi:DNA-binding LacI/PurR family transcriptional regulator